MPVRRTLLLLALLAAVPSLPAAEVTLLKGGTLKGDLVSLDDKELVFSEGEKRVTKPILEVLKIDFKELGKPAAGVEHADVELVDGTLLHCAKWTIKQRAVELTLVAGPTVKLRLEYVANILAKAQEEAARKAWTKRVAEHRGNDVLVLAKEGNPQSLEGTLGDADEAGEAIEFVLAGDSVTRNPKLANVYGLIFKNLLDAKAPARQCKLLDTVQDLVMVHSVTASDKGMTVTTPAGAQIQFGADSLGRLDYSTGKLDYLSDLEPASLVTSSDVEDGDKAEQQHVYKDMSLKGAKTPLSLGSVSYTKGLALRPYTEMVFTSRGSTRSSPPSWGSTTTSARSAPPC